jgi:hypothetical protein
MFRATHAPPEDGKWASLACISGFRHGGRVLIPVQSSGCHSLWNCPTATYQSHHAMAKFGTEARRRGCPDSSGAWMTHNSGWTRRHIARLIPMKQSSTERGLQRVIKRRQPSLSGGSAARPDLVARASSQGARPPTGTVGQDEGIVSGAVGKSRDVAIHA